ncbi:MAG: hypothetical protein NC418_02515 [Muribaculaceae bacterium]|nr:hypothetical protein [Muribaculaceae bacterium]
MKTDSTTTSWTPTMLWEPLQIWTVALAIVKIIISRVACDWEEPYFGMNDFASCAGIILLSFALSIPFGVFRRKRLQMAAFLCADIVLAAGVYITAGSAPGIVAALLMLTTTASLYLIYRRQQRLLFVPAKGKLQYCCYLLVWGALTYYNYLR